MAHGLTLKLRAIRPTPGVGGLIWLHQHRTRMIKTDGKGRPVFVRDGDWVPYVNPARDLKPKARLRVELRVAS